MTLLFFLLKCMPCLHFVVCTLQKLILTFQQCYLVCFFWGGDPILFYSRPTHSCYFLHNKLLADQLTEIFADTDSEFDVNEHFYKESSDCTYEEDSGKDFEGSENGNDPAFHINSQTDHGSDGDIDGNENTCQNVPVSYMKEKVKRHLNLK